MGPGWLGCSAAGVAAGMGAISGSARAIAPTIAGAAAGLIATAALTTSTVSGFRWLALAADTNSSALAGNSAAGTSLRVACKGLAESFANEPTAARQIAPNADIVILNFIMTLPSCS